MILQTQTRLDDEVYDALTEGGSQIFMYSFISYPFCYAQAIGNETVLALPV